MRPGWLLGWIGVLGTARRRQAPAAGPRCWLQHTSLTFVLRLRREPRELAGARSPWRGTIEHLPSGRRRAVQDMDGVVAFLAPYLGEPEGAARGRRRRSWLQWTRLWSREP